MALTPHEFALLEALMSAPGRIFTRDELLDRLYPKGEAVVIDRVVDVHIGKLRQKIEPDPSEPALHPDRARRGLPVCRSAAG